MEQQTDSKRYRNKKNKKKEKDKKLILFAQSRDELVSAQEVLLAIPLKPSDGYAGITQEFLTEYQALFPAVNVQQELRNILAWNNANPKRRKSRGGILKHITHWLTDRQDKARCAPRQRRNGSNATMTTPDGKVVSRAGYETAMAGMRVARDLFGEGVDDEQQ